MSGIFVKRRINERRRIRAEFLGQFEMLRLLEAHRVETVFRKKEQPRAGVGH